MKADKCHTACDQGSCALSPYRTISTPKQVSGPLVRILRSSEMGYYLVALVRWIKISSVTDLVGLAALRVRLLI